MKYTARLPENNVNVTPTSPLKELFMLAGGLLGLAVGLYLLLGLSVDLIVPRLSPEVESKMGTFFIQSYPGVRDDSDEARTVQTMLDDLQGRCAGLPYRFKVFVFDSPAVNAMALPGGNIVVFSGLLEKVTSENELSFVLAHELGHYAHRDHLRGVGRALVFMVISAMLFGPDSSIGNMLGSALSITELSFSRTQETGADAYAVDLLNCAYGHVGGATDFFDKISSEQDPGIFGHYFATHPENRRRISHIKTYAKSKGFKALKTDPLPEALQGLPASSGPAGQLKRAAETEQEIGCPVTPYYVKNPGPEDQALVIHREDLLCWKFIEMTNIKSQ